MAAHGNRRATVAARVTHGAAELVPDPARPQGWTLFVDGVPQSYVNLAEPRHLAFRYVRLLAGVLQAAGPPGRALRVLHLGGGGLTLPRYVSATRPGSVQQVVERDPLLVSLVTRVLPPPADVALIVEDAREFVETTADRPPPGRYDVILIDVFAGAAMPAALTGFDFAAAVARLLAPAASGDRRGGLVAMNLTDVPPLAFSRTQVATVRAAFGDVGLLGEIGMLRGRRAGNLVVVAAATPGELPVRRLAAAAARDPEPARLLHGAELDAFVAGARPRTHRREADEPHR